MANGGMICSEHYYIAYRANGTNTIARRAAAMLVSRMDER